MIGTDSHTPMVNGIGVLAWGVGGLEAESVMFGLPVMMRVPDIVGVRLSGRLRAGVTSTDLALLVTERLRRIDLADRFVEFFGPGVSTLVRRRSLRRRQHDAGVRRQYRLLPDRRRHARLSARHRSAGRAGRTGRSLCAAPGPVVRSRRGAPLHAGRGDRPRPGRSQRRGPAAPAGPAAGGRHPRRHGEVARRAAGSQVRLLRGHGLVDGSVALAAITSCTNTTDPRLLVAAGLVARKAREKDCDRRPM